MRIGKRVLPENIEELILRAKNILEKHHNVVFAYLFGGLAKGRISPISDIDIAIYLLETENILETKLEILSLLIDALNTDEIDLVILNTAPLSLKARIIQNKKVLVDKDPSLRYSFESLTLREYFDFSVKERAIFKRRYNIGR
ncbi:MAG: hypothetical protein CBR30_03680 [Dictyoglomus sp. NZ13-RE01]|nr:MAG: hypothetical protein CBR30_03680 [Dictyoglomus sp. NZ13-RE01]